MVVVVRLAVLAIVRVEMSSEQIGDTQRIYNGMHVISKGRLLIPRMPVRPAGLMALSVPGVVAKQVDKEWRPLG